MASSFDAEQDASNMRLLGKSVRKPEGVDLQEAPSVFSGRTKTVLLLITFLITVCSFAFISVGAIISVCEHHGIEVFTDISIGTFSVCVGAIVLCFAISGFYAIFKRNDMMLHAFSYILVILCMLQIALGVVSFNVIADDYTFKNKARNAVEKVFYYILGHNPDDMKTIDSIQQFFGCCGTDGWSFWLTQSSEVPASCYKYLDRNNEIFLDGCVHSYGSIIRTNITIVGGFALGFCVVELLGAIFVCFVRNRTN